MHCGRYQNAPLTRREMLARAASGFCAWREALVADDATRDAR